MNLEEKIREAVRQGLFYCPNCGMVSDEMKEIWQEDIVWKIRYDREEDDYSREFDGVDYNEQTEFVSHFRYSVCPNCEDRLNEEADMYFIFDDENRNYICRDCADTKKIYEALKEYVLKQMKSKEVME